MRLKATMLLSMMFLFCFPSLINGEYYPSLEHLKLRCYSEELHNTGLVPILLENTLTNCAQLKVLSLKNNNIIMIKDAFSHTPNLEEIDLSMNKLISLREKTFFNLTHLKSINFQFNNITTIEENCFMKVPSLVAIDLRNNNLKTLQFNIIDDTNSLKAIYLGGNEWNCAPNLCEFMHIVIERFWQEPFVPICYSPNGTRGATWKEVIDYSLPAIVTNVRDNPSSEHVIMHCHTCSKTTLSWKKSSNLLVTGTDASYNARQTSNDYFTQSTLTINDFSKPDEGYYTCYPKSCYNCENNSTWVYVYSRVYSTTKYTLPYTTTSSRSYRVFIPIGAIIFVITACCRIIRRCCETEENPAVLAPLEPAALNEEA